MNYIQYSFDCFLYVLNTITIPIPVSSDHIFYFSLFHLLIALIIIGLIIFFFSHITELSFSNNDSKKNNKNYSYFSASSNSKSNEKSNGKSVSKSSK